MFADVELFEIDAAGRVRDYQGERLSRWQVRGRDFLRELGWAIGAEARDRVASFRARRLDLDRFTTRVTTRAGEETLDVTLRRGRDGATTVQLQYARVSDRAPNTARTASSGGWSQSARLSGGGPSSPGLPRTPNQ
jgi:hypothetical protein